MAALTFSFDTLRTGGHFMCKFYQGPEDKALETKLNTASGRVEAHREEVSEKTKTHQTKSEDRVKNYVSLVEADIAKQTAQVEQEHYE